MNHTSSGLKKLMKRMRKLGFIIHKRNGKDIVSHSKADQSYYCHFGDKAIKPIMSWARKETGIDLKWARKRKRIK